MRVHSLLLLCLLTMTGCATMQTYAEYGALDVRSVTLKPVFLRNGGNKLFLQVDCPVAEWKGLETNLAKGFTDKGYQLVAEAVQADAILYIQIRNGQIEKHSARAVQGKDYTAGAGAIAGAGGGYIVSSGDPMSMIVGSVGGLVVGGLMDVTLNSWASLGIVEARADILVLEREGKAPDNPKAVIWRETETSVITKAKQAGLDWNEAAPRVEESLAAQVVSILPRYQ